MTGTTPPREPRGAAAWLAVVLISLCAVLAALLEALLVPLYAGGVLVPVAVALALATNIGFPLLARTVVPSVGGVAAPFVAWLLVLIVFGVVARPEGDVILPGGNAEWVSYGVMLGGALAGTITVVAAVPPRGRPPVERQRDRPTAQQRG